MNNAADLVIDTRGLGKTFDGVNALKSLDIKVPKNSIFGFLGPNGAGKTTTIKLLLGLTRPTSGSGSIFGQDIVTDSIGIRKRVGYLAQDPRFYEHMTCVGYFCCPQRFAAICGYFRRSASQCPSSRASKGATQKKSAQRKSESRHFQLISQAQTGHQQFDDGLLL